MNALITEKVHSSGIELLERYATVDKKFGISRQELIDQISGYEIIIVRVGIKIDQEIIDKGKKLKAIGMAGIGTDHIDVEYARSKGIEVFNVPEGSLVSVAELTMGLMLNVMRKISKSEAEIKQQGKWDRTGNVGNLLFGKTLGIIALGKIGSQVAKFAQAFNMKVIAYDPFISEAQAKQVGADLVDWQQFVEHADVITIHLPLNKHTYHFIDETELQQMKQGVYLINVGRGGVVNEEALYRQLKEGHVKGAAADVMEEEPPGDSKLLQLENFAVTPHIGAGSEEAQKFISEEIARKIIDHLELK